MVIKNNNNFKFIDLFAGIGGFRQAFDKKGFECVFSSEINPACKEVYKANYGEEPFGDISLKNPTDIPDHDVLTAGFPCQPFSICGKRKGFSDTRGTLFFYIQEIIREKQPKIVLLENVKHLIHHDNGDTLKTILKCVEDLGYSVRYKLMNSANFKVPQNRERLIIIATKDKPFDFNSLSYSHKPLQLKSFLDKEGDFEFLDESEYTMIENPKKQESGLIFVGYRNKGIWKTGIRPNTEHLSRVHRQPNRIYSDLGSHPTIPSQETSGRFFIHLSDSNRVRKLTLNECYKIMGFPAAFIKHNSKAECYKQIGNSVCVPMIESIAESILNNNLLVKTNESQRKIIRVISEQQKFAFA
jgi:DNA (cytosine-5)-methyltransferase 1